MGRLTGKYSKANPPPAGRGFSNVNMEELDPLLETMRRIANNRNVSVSSIALNYVICKGNVLFMHNEISIDNIFLQKKVVSVLWNLSMIV